MEPAALEGTVADQLGVDASVARVVDVLVQKAVLVHAGLVAARGLDRHLERGRRGGGEGGGEQAGHGEGYHSCFCVEGSCGWALDAGDGFGRIRGSGLPVQRQGATVWIQSIYTAASWSDGGDFPWVITPRNPIIPDKPPREGCMPAKVHSPYLPWQTEGEMGIPDRGTEAG